MESPYISSYEQWIRSQESDLRDLTTAAAEATSDVELQGRVDRSLRLYEEYAARRRALAAADGPTFFCPPWCSAFENAVLWMGGCRPTLAIRLLYSLSGLDLEARLDDFLRGLVHAPRGGLMALSARQINLVNELHCRTLREEDRLSARLATLHEDVADAPLLPLVIKDVRTSASAPGSPSAGGGGNAAAAAAADGGRGWSGEEAAAAAMESYAGRLAGLVEEGDRLRVATVRALTTEILRPQQAVELLVAAKQLHLTVHDWGRRRDLHRVSV
ncbi:hypothetical protein ACMD2_12859 [Ananas comosus]|uniref:DOG1 domain-containing protein n=1 Tax=Ananas comosus TaxID=4615 RepID=A0A199W0L4_ANACO|nr:hypothetical protein ACMD2_12859 [Ananas comosus]